MPKLKTLSYNMPMAQPAPNARAALLGKAKSLPPSYRDGAAAILILCGLLVFAANLNAFFLSDDFVLLSWTRTHSAGDVAAFFDPNTPWFYRPIVKLVYWAGQAVFGLHAAPFHLFSMLLHGANAFLLYRLVARHATWTAGIAAALIFLLDPHHAETVSWISAVGDLLGTLCILANLLLFRRFMALRSYPALALALALFAVGLLSRETVALLPGLLALQEVVIGGKRGVGKGEIGAAATGYVAVLGAYLLVQRIGAPVSGGGFTRGGLAFHMLNLDSILLGLLDYAHRLLPGGEVPASASLDVLKALVWVEWLIIVAAAVALWRWRQRLVLFGLLWLLLTPLAFIFFSAPTDRYFYLPSIGYAIFLGTLLSLLPRLAGHIHRPGLRPLGLGGAAVALVLLLTLRGATLAGRVFAWKAAGETSGGILHDLRAAEPDPHDYTAFYLVDVPLFRAGIPVFQNGLLEAVQDVYNNTTIAAYSTNCATLQKQTDLPRYSLFFQCKLDGAQQLPTVQDCR